MIWYEGLAAPVLALEPVVQCLVTHTLGSQRELLLGKQEISEAGAECGGTTRVLSAGLHLRRDGVGEVVAGAALCEITIF